MEDGLFALLVHKEEPCVIQFELSRDMFHGQLTKCIPVEDTGRSAGDL
jgi:hypothetical protein